MRLVCVSDKNTWKYQHCLLLTRFLDSLTFPFSDGKWERKKPQIHWCFHCRMVVSYTLITRWKKALTSKLQSVNNWVHNHNHGLVVKGFLQLQKPCLPLSSRVSMVCVHQCFVRREIQNWEHHMREESWGNSWEQWNFKGSNLPFCKECRSLLCIHCWSDHNLRNRFGFLQTPQSTNLNTFSLSIPWQRVKWCTSSSSLSLCKFLQKWDKANSSTQRSLPITPLRISITAFTNKL